MKIEVQTSADNWDQFIDFDYSGIDMGFQIKVNTTTAVVQVTELKDTNFVLHKTRLTGVNP